MRLGLARLLRSATIQLKFLVVIAFGQHPFPFRTRPLSRPRRWYCGFFHGRVGRRRDPKSKGPSVKDGPYLIPERSTRVLSLVRPASRFVLDDECCTTSCSAQCGGLSRRLDSPSDADIPGARVSDARVGAAPRRDRVGALAPFSAAIMFVGDVESSRTATRAHQSEWTIAGALPPHFIHELRVRECGGTASAGASALGFGSVFALRRSSGGEIASGNEAVFLAGCALRFYPPRPSVGG